MFINAHLVPTLIKVLPEIKDLELIIFDGEMESGWEDELRKARGSGGKGLKVVSIEEVERLGRGKREKGGEVWMGEKAKSEDTYCLMYTSGSSECLVVSRSRRGTPYEGTPFADLCDDPLPQPEHPKELSSPTKTSSRPSEASGISSTNTSRPRIPFWPFSPWRISWNSSWRRVGCLRGSRLGMGGSRR